MSRIVTPISVGLTSCKTSVFNIKVWILRFAPSINAIIYHGDKKERNELRNKHMPRSIGPKFPIVVTSYEVALNDARKILRHYNWKYMVVDEVR